MQQKAPRKRGFLFGRGKGTPPWPSLRFAKGRGKSNRNRNSGGPATVVSCGCGQTKTPLSRGSCLFLRQCDQSPRVSSEALPPAAVVFTVTVFSVAKRSR